MKHTILFSDVHLKPRSGEPGVRESFLAFLRGIDTETVDRLVCLGDIFDFWFEYRHALFSGYFDVLAALADLSRRGVELHLVCGNHDFWAGGFLRDTVGFHIHPDRTTMRFGERNALLLHGDGMNRRDYGYRLFKRFARNRCVIRCFRLIHPDCAMALALGLSRSSRSLLQVQDPGRGREAAAIRQGAQAMLAAGKADIVICGHAHAPEMRAVSAARGEGLYINTGDWPQHRSYVVWDGREFTMHHYGNLPKTT